ncbi:MAG: transglycosylase domain-containing protein [Spirochaetes bacterium]|nr:transglycosylase domain-containing protein [Spirochaetota bacterium]
MTSILKIAGKTGRWIIAHRRILFIYIPGGLGIFFAAFVFVVFLMWRSDRAEALNRLAKYKQLIDRTEELKRGYVYTYADVDVTAKVVDIPTRIYDRNGEIIGEFFEQKREIVPYNYIPGWLIKGVIASEDRDFYDHAGISYRGIFRAFLANLVHFRVVQGGSTITQQLAKVLFTDMERNLKRKIYESFCAREIEKRYDKQDILSMYLNLIYFGNGAYGVESAAKMFFGISVRELTMAECAMIVATISNPGVYSPISDLDASLRKTRRILESLADAGFIKTEGVGPAYDRFTRKWDVAYDEKGKAASSLVGSFILSSYRVNRAPFFNEGIRRVLVEKFGEEAVKKGGLKVYTTIDGEKQDIASRVMKSGILRQREYHQRLATRLKDARKAEEEKLKVEQIQGALVTIDPTTGEILAHVGGYEFTSRNQNDHVTQIRRQPGSSFKPIIYAAAIEGRDVTPSTMIRDEKTVFKGGYVPRNYDGRYAGNVIVREALKKSINIVAVKVLEKSGYDGVFRILKKGLYLTDAEMNDRFGKTLSLALGTYELSPLENCALNAILVNGGEFIMPYGLRHVKDYNDTVVWDYEEEILRLAEERRRELGRIIDPVACAVTLSMLKSVFEEGGTAHNALRGRKVDFPVAGKTGTSSNYVDAWFVGYTSDSVTAVWIGNREGSISLGTGRAGGAIAAPLWAEYIVESRRGEHPGDFILPDEGISRETICLDSGEVALKNGKCPRVAGNVIYYSGTEPGRYCHIHSGDDGGNAGEEGEGGGVK